MRTTWWVMIALVAGCDSGAPTCKQALDATFATLGSAEAQGDALKGKFVDLCEQGWAKSARTCLANASDGKQATACLAKLDGDEAHVVAAMFEDEIARRQMEVAQAEANKASDAAAAAQAKIESGLVDMDALNEKLAKAVDAVVAAQNDSERQTARAQLAALQKEKSDLDARLAALKAAAARAERAKGVHISKECMDNPLAKGCN